jgi:hypothetical protein
VVGVVCEEASAERAVSVGCCSDLWKRGLLRVRPSVTLMVITERSMERNLNPPPPTFGGVDRRTRRPDSPKFEFEFYPNFTSGISGDDRLVLEQVDKQTGGQSQSGLGGGLRRGQMLPGQRDDIGGADGCE